MKKMIFALVTMLTLSLSASAMSYEQARNEALFLTDKMAYELNLTDAQYEAAYEINLDYLMGVTSQTDVFGIYWERRNLDLQYILYSWQWEAFRAATYFYRPLYWDAGFWHFGIYARYPHRDYFYFGRPHFYATYRGGHAWHVGGHSYYHSRSSHYRPELAHGRQHFGMRNSFDRGDFRSGRSHSSTRVTGHGGVRPNSSNRTFNGNRGTFNRENRSGSIGGNRSGNIGGNRSGNIGGNRSGNIGGNRSMGGDRSINRGSSDVNRSGSSNRGSVQFGGSNMTPSRSSGSSSSVNRSSSPSRSFGSRPSASHSSSSSSTRSFSSRPSSSHMGGSSHSMSTRGGSRSSGGGHSSGGHGHFGGGRR